MQDTLCKCVKCLSKSCLLGPNQDGPKFCPMRTVPAVFDEVRNVVAEPEIRRMFGGVARTWKDSGLSKNRVEEIMIYSRNMGFRRLGLAFCIGLSDQAKVVSDVFEKRDFDVVSVCCMTGGLCSDDIGLSTEDKMYPDGRQPQCDPVGQAFLMNRCKTDLNVLLGLCVGDDALFIRHSTAPVTILAVKDRVFNHDPLAAIPQYKESLEQQ